jgi:hypothetical protein
MQHADRPAQIQALAQPGRHPCPCIDADADGFVLGSKRAHGIVGHPAGQRHRGQGAPVRASEYESAVGASIEPISLLVDRTVVTTTKHGEVGQYGRPSVCPVADVMAVAEAHAAAWKATATVAMLQSAS